MGADRLMAWSKFPGPKFLDSSRVTHSGPCRVCETEEPMFECGPPAPEEAKFEKRNPPTPLQDLLHLTVLVCQGRHTTFHVLKIAMENIFPVSELTQPAPTKKVLPCHVCNSNVVCIDGNFLVADLE
jgi:hypothetical protein